MSRADYLKSNFHDAYAEATKDDDYRGNGKNFSFKMLQALRDMAERDVYPDGHFSDEECNVWAMFHSAYEGNIKKD